MATVVRVKRRLEDLPSNALLVSCKRQKVEENDNAEENITNEPSILTFVGTINNQDDVNKFIAKHKQKTDLRKRFKQRGTNVLENTMSLYKEHLAQNRYKVINTLRQLNTSIDEGEENIITTLVDVEDSKSCVTLNSENVEFAYDLYYIEQETTVDAYDIECIGMQDGEELVFPRNLHDESYAESVDSNSEEYEGNEYPDEDPSDRSTIDDDMADGFKNMRMHDDDDDDNDNDDDDDEHNRSDSSIDQYQYDYYSDYDEDC